MNANLPVEIQPPFPFQQVLTLISGKWRLLLIESLKDGPVRYGELRRKHPLISEKVLSSELTSLVQLEVLERFSFPTPL